MITPCIISSVVKMSSKLKNLIRVGQWSSCEKDIIVLAKREKEKDIIR